MASTRLRVNDVIYHSLNNPKFSLQFYHPLKHYDIVIFQKIFSNKAFKIASKLKKKGTKIILDINVNYFDKNSKFIYDYQYRNIKNFIKVVDVIITTTNYLKDFIIRNNIFSNVIVIPEMISDLFFSTKKKHLNKERINLLYVGYAKKANALEIIKNVIELLAKKYNIALITICEKKPNIDIKIKKIFIKYDQLTLPYYMTKGDIFLAPRNLNDSYNLGHSFIKIGYPMAIGLPIVASPIPSYLESPAVICYNKTDWYNNLELLIKDVKKRQILGEKGISYCKNRFSAQVIFRMYSNLFNLIYLNKI
ncbi:MAG: hypothetical protein ACTSQP_19255 [Promethearchaeota archaeon]